MFGDVELGKVKVVGIVFIVIVILVFGNIICGFINVVFGVLDGLGLWFGFGVSY